MSFELFFLVKAPDWEVFNDYICCNSNWWFIWKGNEQIRLHLVYNSISICNF